MRVRDATIGAPRLSAYQYAPHYLIYLRAAWDDIPQNGVSSRIRATLPEHLRAGWDLI